MSLRAEIFLDTNAGAPLRQCVVEALLPFFQQTRVLIPNPSSIHSHGREGKRFLAESREQVARSLGQKIDTEQIVFTSSGSEANQWVVQAIKPAHWITTQVEHDSNRQMVKWLEAQGGKVSYIPVDAQGVPQWEMLPDLVRPETALMSVVWVNNETGVITDVEKFSEFARSRDIPLHIDGAQAWGKIPIELDRLCPQFATFSSHKIGGLAGTGVIYLGKGSPVHSVILGKQEKGRRGGTENLFGIIAAGAAAAHLAPQEWSARVLQLRDRLQDAICERIPGTRVNGFPAPRVANTLNLSFEGVRGDGLVMALDLEGYSVSSGSACSSGALEPSHVLLAMGRSRLEAMAAIRVSLDDSVSWETLAGFVDALERAVLRCSRASSIKTL